MLKPGTKEWNDAIEYVKEYPKYFLSRELAEMLAEGEVITRFAFMWRFYELYQVPYDPEEEVWPPPFDFELEMDLEDAEELRVDIEELDYFRALWRRDPYDFPLPTPPPLTPLSQFSAVSQEILVKTLQDAWPSMRLEDRINYLNLGGLDRCLAADVPLSEIVVRVAHLSPEDRAKIVLRDDPEMNEFLLTLEFCSEESVEVVLKICAELWPTLSDAEKVSYLNGCGLERCQANKIEVPANLIEQAKVHYKSTGESPIIHSPETLAHLAKVEEREKDEFRKQWYDEIGDLGRAFSLRVAGLEGLERYRSYYGITPSPHVLDAADLDRPENFDWIDFSVEPFNPLSDIGHEGSYPYAREYKDMSFEELLYYFKEINRFWDASTEAQKILFLRRGGVRYVYRFMLDTDIAVALGGGSCSAYWLNYRYEPFSRHRPDKQRGLNIALQWDWPTWSREERIAHLKKGGLEYCQAAGIEVDPSLLDEAGLSGSN